MLRQASRHLARTLRAGARPFSTDLSAAPTTDSAFVESWKKVIPNIEPPKTPSHFMQPRPPTASSIPSKITVNFVLPYASELSTKEVPRSSSLIGLFLFWFFGFFFFWVFSSGFFLDLVVDLGCYVYPIGHFSLDLLFVDFFFSFGCCVHLHTMW